MFQQTNTIKLDLDPDPDDDLILDHVIQDHVPAHVIRTIETTTNGKTNEDGKTTNIKQTKEENLSTTKDVLTRLILMINITQNLTLPMQRTIFNQTILTIPITFKQFSHNHRPHLHVHHLHHLIHTISPQFPP